MINHLQLATDGLAPGHSTYNTATLGYGYKLEVEIFVVDFYAGESGNVELIPISLLSILNAYSGQSNEIDLTHFSLFSSDLYSGEANEANLTAQVNLSLDSYSGQVNFTDLTTIPKTINQFAFIKMSGH